VGQRRPPRTRPIATTSPSRSLRRRLARANRAQIAFSALALLVVFSLIVTALGTAIVDRLSHGGSSDQPIPVDQNQPDAYEQQLRKQVTATPNDAPTMALLASYLAQTGQLTEAIAWYEKSLAIAPDAWDVRLDFARSLSDGGKRNDAELQFKKVIAGQPHNAQAHYYLAELYRNWIPARTADAVAEYRRTIEVGSATYVADLAAQALKDLGYATPVVPATPGTAGLEATP
jgi:cytochrome c-type biogenesis protein CcmH/NrfG